MAARPGCLTFLRHLVNPVRSAANIDTAGHGSGSIAVRLFLHGKSIGYVDGEGEPSPAGTMQAPCRDRVNGKTA